MVIHIYSATDTEKDQYTKIIKLHPELPKIFEQAANDENAADALAAVVSAFYCIYAPYVPTYPFEQIDFHIGEAKNSDTNTIKYTIVSFIPLDPKKDVVDPPITGSGKDNRGFNHLVTGAALCPLKDHEKYEQDAL